MKKPSTVTKADLIRELRRLNMDSKRAKMLVECFFEQIQKALERKESVKLPHFGTFNVLHKKARPGRNPKTGEEVEVSERYTVSFKASRQFRSRLNKN